MVSESETVLGLIKRGRSSSVAICYENQAPLTYQGFGELAIDTVSALNQIGIGRNDRVAIVLPNGAMMATAFVCVSGAATTAPLNPNYRQEEFEFYLDDLNARALMVEQGSDSPAIDAAKKLGVLVIY